MLDTPNQSVATKGSPSFPQYDCCSKFFPGIIFMNFMDDADDASMNIFTNDQIFRMRSVLMVSKSNIAFYLHCYNGILDGGETGINCGGSCPTCIIQATCYDGIKNQNETGIDCGGVCPPCGIGGSLNDIITETHCLCNHPPSSRKNSINIFRRKSFEFRKN